MIKSVCTTYLEQVNQNLIKLMLLESYFWRLNIDRLEKNEEVFNSLREAVKQGFFKDYSFDVGILSIMGRNEAKQRVR